MATYAIGDVQGCFDQLKKLLEKIGFSRKDRLWLVGDLVNRGPKSLETLRFVRDLGDRAVTVLGNHDLHLLAIVYGGHEARDSDTFRDVLEADDCRELAKWLRCLPLLHESDEYVMVHAGIPHIWSLKKSKKYAREVETVMSGKDHVSFFREMYGNHPSDWSATLHGMDRLRIITNYFTRMRLTDIDGGLEFQHKGTLHDIPEGYAPWFTRASKVNKRIVFGHWAALDGMTGSKKMIALDTGCVWGRSMTALRLEDRQLISVGCW